MNNLTFIFVFTVFGVLIFVTTSPSLWWVGGLVFFGSSIIGCLVGAWFEKIVGRMYK